MGLRAVCCYFRRGYGHAASRGIVHVVDDDPSFRTSVARLLTVAGFASETYESAQAYLPRVPHPAGCLLLDIHMPGMTGLELYETLKAQNRSLPVVFVTGRSDPALQHSVERAGAVDFLTKPVLAERLFAAVGRALQDGPAPPSERLSAGDGPDGRGTCLFWSGRVARLRPDPPRRRSPVHAAGDVTPPPRSGAGAAQW